MHKRIGDGPSKILNIEFDVSLLYYVACRWRLKIDYTAAAKVSIRRIYIDKGISDCSNSHLSGQADSSLRLRYQAWGDIDGADPALNPAMVPTADPERSGGQRFDVLIGLNLMDQESQSNGGSRLGVEFGLPVWQKLDGPQLEVDWFLTVGAQLLF